MEAGRDLVYLGKRHQTGAAAGREWLDEAGVALGTVDNFHLLPFLHLFLLGTAPPIYSR